MEFKQEILVAELKRKLPPGENIAELIAETLHVSIDSAYRRLNGKTAITFDEACQLAKKFELALDTISETSKGLVAFSRRNIIKNVDDIENNLNSMLHFFDIQKKFDNPHVIYSTKDIPVFYHFAFPELAAFKLFTWINAVSSQSSLKDQFIAEEYIERFEDVWKKLIDSFTLVPSQEMWSELAVRSFIRQLDYYYASGLMGNKKLALTICDQLKSLFEVIEKQAILGCRIHPAYPETKTVHSFELYFNDLLVMENAVLAFMGDRKLFFQAFAYFNFLPTSDQEYCNQMEFWLKNQMKKSVKLSDTREKERNQYFMRIHHELDLIIEKIRS